MLYLPVCSGSRTGGRGWSSRPRVALSLCLVARTLAGLLRAHPFALLVAGWVPGLALGGGGHRASPSRGRTALCDKKARSPRLSHPWHASPSEERRRHGDVLAFSALELLGFEARAAAKPRRHLPNSAEGASIWLKARRWRRGFARTLRLASCCLCGLKTINRAGSREGLSAGPWKR